MKKATQEDKKLVVDILQSAFGENNPTFDAVTKKNNRSKHILRILNTSVDYALRRQGVFLSDDKDAVAICYENKLMKDTLTEKLKRYRLAITCFPTKKIRMLIKHFKYIEKQRPPQGRYLYFWFLGSRPQKVNPRSTAQLVIQVLKKAKQDNLTIYAETTMPKNKMVYERYGFETFNQYYNKNLDLTVWFMRKA